MCIVFYVKDSTCTLLSVHCSNWTDPDDEVQAFVYLYETITRRKLSSGPNDMVSFVYEGSMWTNIIENHNFVQFLMVSFYQ